MTDRKELEQLQSNARAMGRKADFVLDDYGYIRSVDYQDSNGGPLSILGMFLNPLSFAEIERKKQSKERKN